MATIIRLLAIIPFFIIGTCAKEISVPDVFFDAPGGQKTVVANRSVRILQAMVGSAGSVIANKEDGKMFFEYDWLTIQTSNDSNYKELIVTTQPNETGLDRKLQIDVAAGYDFYGSFTVYQSAD